MMNIVILLSLIIAFTVPGVVQAKAVYQNGTWFDPSGLSGPVMPVQPPPVPSPPTAASSTSFAPATTLADPLLPLNGPEASTELAPTSSNPDISYNFSYNMAGKHLKVVPLKTGSILLNDSTDHVIAVNEFTPVGAASKFGNNKDADMGEYDFIIPVPILE